MAATGSNGETKMSAREMTIFGIVFLILGICAQEFLDKISMPIFEMSDCKTKEVSMVVRGTTVPYAISIVFLLFPRVLRLYDKWKQRRNGNGRNGK